jgi:hypothetical protein
MACAGLVAVCQAAAASVCFLCHYRILGGKSIDDLQLGGAALEGLAGDERFAESEEQRSQQR